MMMTTKTRQAPVQLPENTSQAGAEYEEVCPSMSKTYKQTFEMGTNVAYGLAT